MAGENRGLERRTFLKAASLGTAAVALLANRSLRKLLRGRLFTEGHAQDSVKELKTVDKKTLVEMDKKMDKNFKRIFSETDKDGYPVEDGKGTSYIVTARVDDSNSGSRGIYLDVTAGTNSETLGKSMTIEFPIDRSRPNGKRKEETIDLQKLHDYYVEACKAAGCVTKDKLWIKLMFSVDDNGVFIYATFVDAKPKNGDSSDMKHGYPVMVCRYFKGSNGVSPTYLYRRIDAPDEIAKRATQ